jgi:hypothetical protein
MGEKTPHLYGKAGRMADIRQFNPGDPVKIITFC